MIKKLIEKFNKFIQWTKIQPFWHMLIPTSYFFSIILILVLSCESLLQGKGIIKEDLLWMLMYPTFFLYCFSFVVLPISILLVLINYFRKKSNIIKNKFLISNKKYNIFYFISFYGLLLSIFSSLIIFIHSNATGYIFAFLFFLGAEYIILLPIYIVLIKSSNKKERKKCGV